MAVTVRITVGIGTVGIRIVRFGLGLGVSRTLANTLGASVGERSASGVTGYASKAIIATIAIGISTISVGMVVTGLGVGLGLGISRTLTDTLGASVGERSASGVTGYSSEAIITTIAIIGIGTIGIGMIITGLGVSLGGSLSTTTKALRADSWGPSARPGWHTKASHSTIGVSVSGIAIGIGVDTWCPAGFGFGFGHGHGGKSGQQKKLHDGDLMPSVMRRAAVSPM